jgi:hypothetical protein
MRSQQFIDALNEAGWRPTHDAQHDQIIELWAKLFPTVAELELEIEDLNTDINLACRRS